MSDQRAPSYDAGVAAGCGLTILLHLGAVVLLVIIGMATGGLALVLLAALGVVQLLYMAPAIIMARNQGRLALARGLIIGAALTFILNAACWGLITLPSLLG